jgi:hypothetical protein
VTDFPVTVDYGRPGQLVITRPIISDITGDNLPDIVITAFDSLLHAVSDNVLLVDTLNVIDTTLHYNYYNYYSATYVVSPGIRRIEGFPVPSGIFGIRQPGDTVIGAGAALHIKSGERGLLVTTGADGWMNAWECRWSDKAAFWPMTARTPDGFAYLSLGELGAEVSLSEFLPEAKFYNYPNPATGAETRIRFYVNQPASVKITIFDALGDEVWEIRQEVTDGNSETEIPWNLSGIASGVYHCRLEAVTRSGTESKVAFKTIAVIK